MGIIQALQERFITLVDVELFLKSLSEKTEIDVKTLCFFIDKEALNKSIDLTFLTSNGDFFPSNKTLSKPILKKINQILHGASFFIALRDKDYKDRLFISLEQLEKIDEELEISDDCHFLFNKDNLKKSERQLIIGDNQLTHSQTEQVQALQARIAELEKELQNLKKTEEQNQKMVNYDKCSIYGHSSEGIEIILKMSKTIAETCDPDNPHSYPSKLQIIDEVKRTYSDSNELATAIYQVITADKVKKRGRPPKDIDTFKGFR